MSVNKQKLNILRLVLVGALLCLIMFRMWVIQVEIVPRIAEWLEEINPKKTDDMKNTLWLIEHQMYIIPVIFVLFLQAVIYCRAEANVKHRENFLQLVAVFVFTFVALLAFAIWCDKNYPPQPDPETGAETLSVLMRSAEWFMWQFMIMLVPMLYHKVKITETLPKDTEEETETNEED